jgi:hypothetical protein
MLIPPPLITEQSTDIQHIFTNEADQLYTQQIITRPIPLTPTPNSKTASHIQITGDKLRGDKVRSAVACLVNIFIFQNMAVLSSYVK